MYRYPQSQDATYPKPGAPDDQATGPGRNGGRRRQRDDGRTGREPDGHAATATAAAATTATRDPRPGGADDAAGPTLEIR